MIDENILVIGDIHLGVNKNNPEFFQTALKYADWINDLCQKNKIKTIVQLGDIFHNREMVHLPALNCAHSFFNKLSKYKVHIITGNHDSLLNETSEVNSLKLLNNWPNITVHEKVSSIDGICFCGWGTKLSEIPDNQKIIFGHFDIKGFHMSTTKVSEHGFTASELMSKCRLLMSGHYHKPQVRFYDKKPLVYTGSTYQLNWGESGEDKFAYILNTTTLKYTSILNDVSPKFVYIKSETDLADVKNNFISVEVETPEQFNEMVIKLKSLQAVDVRTTLKPIKKTSIDSNVQTFKGVSIEAVISEYISLIEDVSDTDKVYIENKLKEIYNKCV